MIHAFWVYFYHPHNYYQWIGRDWIYVINSHDTVEVCILQKTKVNQVLVGY